MLCTVITIIICYIVNIFFGICLCSMFICQKSRLCNKMVTFLFSTYFGSLVCYHNNGKVKSVPDIYTWAVVLIHQ